MSITTRTVSIATYHFTGAPAAGARWTFELLRADPTDNAGGIVAHKPPVTATCDTDGLGSAALWPNALGTSGQYYKVQGVTADGDLIFSGYAVVPNANCDLHDILVDPAPATVDAATAAVAAATAQAVRAEEAADSVVTSSVRFDEAQSLTAPEQAQARSNISAQPLDADLTALAGLTSAANKLPYFTGSGTAALADFTAAGRALLDDADATAQRATLGLGSVDNTADADKPVSTAQATAIAVVQTSVNDHVADATGAHAASAISNTPAGAIAATTVQAAINELDAEKQPLDAELTALAGLTSAANKLPYFTGSGTATLADFTAAGRALVDDADATAQRTTLGLGNVEDKSSATIRGEITGGNVTAALGYTPVDAATVGAAGGVAPLDGGGKVASSYLPSFVDDVLEVANYAALPGTGEAGKIYVTLDTGQVYRWSGSVYVEISASPGSTDAVPEGATNLYHTAARVRATLLDGLSLATATVIGAGDSVLTALGKLQGQASALDLAKAALAGAAFTGAVSAASFAGPLTGDVTGNVSGNAATATALATARNINGVSFDGTGNITVTAAAGTLSGATLNATVTASSLTSVGTIATGVWQGTAIADTYLATISTGGKVANSATTAASANTASAIVARDASGNFTAGTITAALTGNASTATTLATARNINGVSFNGSADITVAAAAGTLTGNTLAAGVTSSSLTSVGTIGAGVWQGTAIADTYLATISTGGKVANSATTAASANTASAIVARDGSGNFAAGTITAALTGNASTATALATARAINGVNFDGTAAITVTAAAGTLTGATLAAGVTASSLTSVGTLASLAVSGASTLGLTRISGADGAIQLGVAGGTRGIRFNTSSYGSSIEGVDNTLAASFQPLNIGASILNLFTSGSGAIALGTNAATVQAYVTHTASAVNVLAFTGGATGSPARISTYSVVDTNPDLLLAPQGTGVLCFGTHSALAAETVTGYITIKDGGGTTRKLAVLS